MRFGVERQHGRVSWGLIVFLGVFSILFIGGALMLTNIGPSRGGGGKAPRNVELEKKRQVLREMIESTPMWTVDELDEEKIEQLDKVVEQWGSISRVSSGRELKGYDRIENLLSIWGKSQSMELEHQARSLIAEGDKNLAKGIDLLEAAARRQRKVNARFPNASGKDMKRVMSLEGEVRSLLAEPILTQANELEKKGKLALENGDAETALESFREAEQKFRELHVKFPDYSKAHVGRLTALGKLAGEAESWEEMQRLRKMLSNAETVVRAGRFLSGAKMYNNVLKGLYKLGDSSGSEVEKMLETAGKGLGEAVTRHFEKEYSEAWLEVDRTMRQAAVSDHKIWGSVEKVRAIRAEITEEFPKFSDRFDLQLERLEFLEKRRNGLVPQILSLRKDFLNVPGKPGWKMFRCEVWQDLYSGMVDSPNPSRTQGDQLPVESVTIMEAQEFAEKVSWLLGVKVVLPSEELFFAAAGSPQSPQQIPIVPLGRMVPAKSGNTLNGGFYHLWGNVSEWLAQKEPGSDLAEHTGGHFLDTGESLFQELVRKETIRDRSRSIGFRIAYQVPAD